MEDLAGGGDKKHRKKKSGAKADKKVLNKKKKLGQSTDRHNPRAFSVSGIVKTKRTQQRNLDKAQKKELVPLINRVGELLLCYCHNSYVGCVLLTNAFEAITMLIDDGIVLNNMQRTTLLRR